MLTVSSANAIPDVAAVFEAQQAAFETAE